jgi:hypothetical protein
VWQIEKVLRKGNSRSIRVSFEPRLEENNESLSHSSKSRLPIVSTELGTQIDRNAEK